MANSPSPIWADARSVQLLCNIAGGPGIDHLAESERLCALALPLVRTGIALPVRAISFGDPAVLSADSVTLLIHGSLTGVAKGRMLALNVRPFRSSAEQTEVLFGAPPRAVMLPDGRVGGAALTNTLNAMFDEILPWRSVPSARPISN